MKKLFLLAMAAALPLGVMAQDAKKADTDTVKGFQFTDVKTVKTGSVKDQNKSGTCWSFSGTSFIEDEIMRKGGPELDLSEMFTVRHCYDDKADKYLRMDGKINFAQGGGPVGHHLCAGQLRSGAGRGLLGAELRGRQTLAL